MDDGQDTRDALDALAALWRRENVASRARFAEERNLTPFPERVARGLALRRLHVEDVGPAPGDLSMVWVVAAAPDEVEACRLSPGDPLLLWKDRPDEEGAVRATLARRRGDRLGLMVRGEPDLLDAAFNLDRDDPDATFARGLAGIEAFRRAGSKEPLGLLREVLFGGAAPVVGAEEPLVALDAELNEPQLAAVRRALAAEQVALIHGPPGTGKTRTLVEVVRQHVARGRRVLATAASNQAVDNLAERLVAAGVELVRLGHPARVAPALEGRLLSTLLEEAEETKLAREWFKEAHLLRREGARRGRRAPSWEERREQKREVDRLFRDARQQLERSRRAILASTPVVCATAAGADAELLRGLGWDVVVVDEATQAPDPVALCALCRGERVVLAGDPCQLPPTVIDLDVARAGLGTTLFERLAARAPEAVRMLEVQHRMHEAIMAFPSARMYEDRLRAAPAVAAHVLEDLGVAPDPLRPSPLCFVDSAGKGWEEERRADDPSTRNPLQAERTAAEVRRLISRGLPARDVAVIAPYDAQVRLLRDLLAAERAAGLSVRSIDGFQGQEREAVVLDLVRSNDEGELGFLTDTRRLNVALTRARRFLLVVGDSATVGRHPFYAAFLEAVEVFGSYLSAWTDEAELL
ncbi:MAG: AAA domain-containing protein [Planctomycetota bacterium]